MRVYFLDELEPGELYVYSRYVPDITTHGVAYMGRPKHPSFPTLRYIMFDELMCFVGKETSEYVASIEGKVVFDSKPVSDENFQVIRRPRTTYRFLTADGLKLVTRRPDMERRDTGPVFERVS